MEIDSIIDGSLLHSKPNMDIKDRMWKGTDILYSCRVSFIETNTKADQ